MPDSILANLYDPLSFYDEVFESPGEPRPHYEVLCDHLQTMTAEMFAERRRVAEAAFLYQGITSMDRSRASSGFFRLIWSRALSRALNGILSNED